VTRLIKRCNDFGAGGVSVSVGELADVFVRTVGKAEQVDEDAPGSEGQLAVA
jgi:phosphoribosylformylglycinamidine (FGAM) synthase-like enzyme